MPQYVAIIPRNRVTRFGKISSLWYVISYGRITPLVRIVPLDKVTLLGHVTSFVHVTSQFGTTGFIQITRIFLKKFRHQNFRRRHQIRLISV